MLTTMIILLYVFIHAVNDQQKKLVSNLEPVSVLGDCVVSILMLHDVMVFNDLKEKNYMKKLNLILVIVLLGMFFGLSAFSSEDNSNENAIYFKVFTDDSESIILYTVQSDKLLSIELLDEAVRALSPYGEVYGDMSEVCFTGSRQVVIDMLNYKSDTRMFSNEYAWVKNADYLEMDSIGYTYCDMYGENQEMSLKRCTTDFFKNTIPSVDK